MDDQCSVLSSCYWDATSITSDGTIPTEFYHTPTGSLLDISIQATSNSNSTDSKSLTQNFYDMEDSNPIVEEVEFKKIDSENIPVEKLALEVKEVPSRPPLIKQKSTVEENIENKLDEPVRKRSWKHDIAKRLSYTKTRIIKSFSIHKNKDESRSTKNIFVRMHHSMRKMKPFDKKSNSTKNIENCHSKTASDVIGSDCEYFNFIKDATETETIKKSEDYSFDPELDAGTPIKPRRQLTQEKYLTGSNELLKQAYNSLKRKSHMQDDKSLFDVCSTVSYIFSNELDSISFSEKEELIYRKFMTSCIDAFLDVHNKQIETSLINLNKTIGDHINLNSQNLDVINKSKKYQITEIFGSKGICIITNVINQKKFIALKTGLSKNWMFFRSFLQHIERDVSLSIDQMWICFPAQSITNLYIEKNFFNSQHLECKLLLDSLIQLIIMLYCQTVNHTHIKLNPSNILIVSSNLSIIFVFIESNGETNNTENQLLNLHDYSDKEMRLTYQQSIMKLNKYVDQFLSSPANASHLITASYPLDYLFYLLLKLNKDINVLLSTL